MGRVRRVTVVVTGLVAMLAGATFASDSARQPRDADALLQSALRRLDDSTFDSRRTAIGELEQACKLAPERRICPSYSAGPAIDAGQLDRGRQALARAAKLRPDDADVQLELAGSWRWDWLSSLGAPRSCTRSSAICARRSSRRSAPRPGSGITALEIVSGKMTTTRAAAIHAYESDPDGWAALLALRCASYWTRIARGRGQRVPDGARPGARGVRARSPTSRDSRPRARRARCPWPRPRRTRRGAATPTSRRRRTRSC